MCKLVMGTRWESSTRPLFVKTVWVDGHHHVILSKRDPLAEYVHSDRSRAKSSAVRSSAKITSKSPSCRLDTAFPNLRVPSVKLLLGGIKQFGNENKRHHQCEHHKSQQRPKTVTANTYPSNRSRKDEIEMEAFSYGKIKMQLLNNLKASSLDVEESKTFKNRESYTSKDLTATKLEHPENRLTSLSERVMVWLDLAIQNGDYRDEFPAPNNANKGKKRLVTAHQCSNMKPKKLPANFSMDDGILNSSEHPLQEIEASSCSPAPSTVIPQPTFPKHPNHRNDVQISSHQETSKELRSPATEFPKKPPRRDSCKRQLHIFIPNLPKRCNNDLDSNLSSTSGSLLTASGSMLTTK